MRPDLILFSLALMATPALAAPEPARSEANARPERLPPAVVEWSHERAKRPLGPLPALFDDLERQVRAATPGLDEVSVDWLTAMAARIIQQDIRAEQRNSAAELDALIRQREAQLVQLRRKEEAAQGEEMAGRGDARSSGRDHRPH